MVCGVLRNFSSLFVGYELANTAFYSRLLPSFITMQNDG